MSCCVYVFLKSYSGELLLSPPLIFFTAICNNQCVHFSNGQVRYEASHLEHERRALRAARSSLALSAEDLVELEPPLPLPPTSRWMPPKPPGCGPTCGRSHSGDGDCLVCGQGWGNHNGHNCSGGRGRGSWRV